MKQFIMLLTILTTLCVFLTGFIVFAPKKTKKIDNSSVSFLDDSTKILEQSTSRPLLPLGSEKVRKVVIDAGHGGKDPGCLGKFSQEKDVALEIAFRLGALIRTFHKDVEVSYTRTGDTFLELHERAKFANRVQADLFISIHCNASTKNESNGTETYVMGLGNEVSFAVAERENSVILQEDDYVKRYQGFDPRAAMTYILIANYHQTFRDKSLRLAQKIEQQFGVVAQLPSRGVKQERFYVLAKTLMPSVLIEVGFLSNERDEIYLNTEEGKEFTAVSIYRAFRDYKNDVEDKY
jgi:N-acetylmuramoyl-L-alanine amidase